MRRRGLLDRLRWHVITTATHEPDPTLYPDLARAYRTEARAVLAAAAGPLAARFRTAAYEDAARTVSAHGLGMRLDKQRLLEEAANQVRHRAADLAGKDTTAAEVTTDAVR